MPGFLSRSVESVSESETLWRAFRQERAGLVVLFINTLTYFVLEFQGYTRYAGVSKETLLCREKAHIALC